MNHPWAEVNLEDVCVTGGLVRGPFGGSLKKSDFVRSGYQVYEQRHAIGGTAEGARYFISPMKFAAMRRFAVEPGDFIVSCSGTIGRLFRIPEGAPPGVINQALLKLTVNTDVIDPRFFSIYFSWDKFQNLILDSTQGGAMQNLVGMPIFKKSPFRLPGLAEQRLIADKFASVDALITSLEQLIAKKKAIKQGMMQRLLTGRTRLPGYSKPWRETTLGEVLTVRHGRNQQSVECSDGIYPILATGGQIGRTNTPLYSKPSVLIGRKGTIDRPQYRDEPFWTVDTLFYTEIRESNVPKYLYYLFLMIDWRSKNEASGVPSLSSSAIESVSAIMPDFEEQRAITDVLTSVDAELHLQGVRLSKAKSVKNGMMQEFVTGRTRLQPAEAMVRTR